MVAAAACRVHNEPSQPPEVGWPDAPRRAIHDSTAQTWEAAGRPAPGSRPEEGNCGRDRAWLATQTQPAAEIVAELVSQM
jgi:hypothetical protein